MALTPALQIAIGVLNMAAEAMSAARQAEQIIRAEGAGDLDVVDRARRRLRAETILSTDDFEAALDAADRAAPASSQSSEIENKE